MNGSAHQRSETDRGEEGMVDKDELQPPRQARKRGSTDGMRESKESRKQHRQGPYEGSRDKTEAENSASLLEDTKSSRQRAEEQARLDGRRVEKAPRRRIRRLPYAQGCCGCGEKRVFGDNGYCLDCGHRRCAECLVLEG